VSIKKRVSDLKREKEGSIKFITSMKDKLHDYYKRIKKEEKNIKEINYLINVLEQRLENQGK
jgi:hypothetical protein